MARRKVQVEIPVGKDDDRESGKGPGISDESDECTVGWVKGPEPKAFKPLTHYQKSAIEERKLAKRLGGHALPRSGGVAWSRYDKTTAGGDVTTPDLHIEHKRLEPTTKSIGVKRQWLAKVTEGARRKMKTPAMAFHFAGAQGYAEDWVMLPLDVVERLLAAAKEDE